MDGVHDLGGRVGFGTVEVEVDEPVFHQRWEARVFGTAAALLVGGVTGGPMFRHSIERMDPVHYLASGYYEHWMTGIATVAVEKSLIGRQELIDRAGGFPLSGPVAAYPLPDELGGAPAQQPRFAVGDAVRVRNVHPMGHTRCPDYVRDRRGEIVRVDDAAHVPEIEAHRGENLLETVYCVRFSCRELWGDDQPGHVHVDLYERYLASS